MAHYQIRKLTDDHMRINGTESWGEVWELIESESGDFDSVDALFCGFFVSEPIANRVKASLEHGIQKAVEPQT